jgi:hypothetical protein
MSGDIDVTVKPIDININGLDNAKVDLGLDDVNIDVGLDDVNVDLGLDDIKVALGLKIDEIKADLKTRLTVDELKAELAASVKELAPIFFNFLWKEIPIVKIGFPHRYRLGLTVCGKELLAVTFCGESEIITEKNLCGEGGCGNGQAEVQTSGRAWGGARGGGSRQGNRGEHPRPEEGGGDARDACRIDAGQERPAPRRDSRG